jgi:hypothetical protein
MSFTWNSWRHVSINFVSFLSLCSSASFIFEYFRQSKFEITFVWDSHIKSFVPCYDVTKYGSISPLFYFLLKLLIKNLSCLCFFQFLLFHLWFPLWNFIHKPKIKINLMSHLRLIKWLGDSVPSG